MTEQPNFGHHHGHAFGVHIDGWGDGPLLIRHGNREWFFEFSLMFGPTILRKRDLEPADRQPIHEHDPFWFPFQRWMDGGRKCRAVYGGKSRVTGQRKLRFWLCHVPAGLEPATFPLGGMGTSANPLISGQSSTPQKGCVSGLSNTCRFALAR